ncbi:hypothetical protein GCM10010517_70550 [Streptosporangium fragile]|uniref:Uncharacterized protein n=1 Tax=Streptosporangium fragile TaxID=46186 RepID=A0ABN3W953_9ACTN
MLPDETAEAPFPGVSNGEVYLWFAYEAFRTVIILGALLLSALLIAAVIVATLYYLPRRLMGLRRGPRLRDDRQSHEPASWWLA